MQSQVIHGNCHQILPTLPKNFVQTIFVDPPYNIGIDYGNGAKADRLPEHEYLSGLARLIQNCVERLTATGSLWFLISERWADQVGTMLSSVLPRRNRIIWRETFGQYGESKFPGGHRHLFWHVRDKKKTPFFTDDIRVTSQRMLDNDPRAKGPRVPDDVWDIPRLVGNAAERNGKHRCQLPKELLRRVVLSSTQPNDVVMDPMAGTGTTLRVAQSYGRRYFGIEEQPQYVELIEDRLSEPYQEPLFG